MPRTKRPVRKQEHKSKDENDAFNKEMDKLVLALKNKVDARAEMEISNLKLAYKIFLGSLSSEYLQKTIGQLKAEELKEVETANVTHKSRSASHDDGYLTENSSQGSGDRHKKKQGIPVPTSRQTGRRSRSADASRRAPSAVKPPARRRSRSMYRTPVCKTAANYYPPITPKVAPQTPLTVLRQPRQGEMVVSMAGSPVMVPSCYTMQPDAMASCNILLQDGTMLSLQPKQLRQSQVYIPFSLMAKGMLGQLKTLQDNLDHVVKLGEKAMK